KPASFRRKVKLAADVRRLPALGEAIEQRTLGTSSATLVARVATRATAAAWIDRARGRTVKHLEEEVLAVELIERVTPVGEPSPPSPELMRDVLAIQGAVQSGALRRNEVLVCCNGQSSNDSPALDDGAVVAARQRPPGYPPPLRLDRVADRSP